MKSECYTKCITAGILCFASLTTTAAIEAAVFKVNSFEAGADASPGDGECRDANGACTFQAALDEANARVGKDNIVLSGGRYTLGRNDESLVTDPLVISGDRADTTMLGAIGSAVTLKNSSELVLQNLSIGFLSNNTGRTITLKGVSVRGGHPFSNLGNAVIRFSYVYGIYNTGMLNAQNSTFGGATVRQGDSSPDTLSNRGRMVLKNVTVLMNKVEHNFPGIPTDQMAIFSYSGSTISYINSILVGDCWSSPSATVYDQGNNIATQPSCKKHGNTRVESDPGLSPLRPAIEGNGTLVAELGRSSPAINTGTLICPSLDQRKFPRADGKCDIGAFEYGAVAP